MVRVSCHFLAWVGTMRLVLQQLIQGLAWMGAAAATAIAGFRGEPDDTGGKLPSLPFLGVHCALLYQTLAALCQAVRER